MPGWFSAPNSGHFGILSLLTSRLVPEWVGTRAYVGHSWYSELHLQGTQKPCEEGLDQVDKKFHNKDTIDIAQKLYIFYL